MNTHSVRRPRLALLAAVALLAATAALPPLAAAGAPAGIGGPGVDPVAGPVEVFVHADVLTSPLGSLVETDLLVENSADEPVRVFLFGRFTWPDGSTSLLRYGRPVTIDAGGALVVNALSPIPDGVGSGTGTFTVTAVVGPIGTGGRSDYPGGLIARDGATFELP